MDQEIFNSTNELTSHQFVLNKFVQEFVTISLLFLFFTQEILPIKLACIQPILLSFKKFTVPVLQLEYGF